MEPHIVENELRTNKIKQGVIFQRSKFLMQWQERWMVITLNYIYIFSDNSLKALNECLDLSNILDYKSYLRKQNDMLTAGFRLNYDDQDYYFCARGLNQKWCWIVALQRVIDFKVVGTSKYNSMQMLKKYGFMGVDQLNRGRFNQPLEVLKQQAQQNMRRKTDKDLGAQLQSFQETQKIKRREQELARKEKEQQEIFLFELNKLKKAEQALKQLQSQVERKKVELDMMIQQVIDSAANQQKISTQIIVQQKPVQNTSVIEITSQEVVIQIKKAQLTFEEKIDEAMLAQQAALQANQVVNQPIEIASQNSNNQVTVDLDLQAQEKVSHEANVSHETKQIQQQKLTEETVVSTEEQKSQNSQQNQTKIQDIKKIEQPELTNNTPQVVVESQPVKESRVSMMKKLYESKMASKQTNLTSTQINMLKLNQAKSTKQEKKSKQIFLHLCRDKVIVNLFEEFHEKAYEYPGLRTIIEFMIKICAQRGLGYQQYFVRQAKAHQNRFLFGQVLLEIVNNFKQYSASDKLCKIIELLIFEVPGIFKPNHFDLIKKKLTDMLFNCPKDELEVVIKTMYVTHKMKRFSKDQKLKQKITEVIDILPEGEGKGWARKLLQDQ